MSLQKFQYSDEQATADGQYEVSLRVPDGWHFQGSVSLWKPVGDGRVTLDEVHYLADDAEKDGSGATIASFLNRVVVKYTISGSTSSSFLVVVESWAERIPADRESDTARYMNLFT